MPPPCECPEAFPVCWKDGWGADQSCYYSEDSQYPGRECRNTCTGDYVAMPRSRGGGFFSFFRGGRLVEESANAPKSPRLLPVAAAASGVAALLAAFLTRRQLQARAGYAQVEHPLV